MEKIKPEDTVFVIIKQTIEEQFGNPKTGEIPKFPEIIIDGKEFEIKIVGDHTTREAFGTILQEEDNYPTHFKINFEKSDEGLVAKLPIKDNSRKIAINLEQPVQRGYTSIAPITGSTVTVTRPQPTLRPELMSFTTCPECDEVTKAQEIDIIVRVFEDRKKNSPQTGCIDLSLDLIMSLAQNIPDSKYEEGLKEGAFGFWTTAIRTWMRLTTKCFIFDTVATWYGPFRHQAVQVSSRWPDVTEKKIVLDTWWLNTGWESLTKWAGGASELEDTGLVKDGF